MAKRVRLNGGHTEFSIEGILHQADETGAFVVPDEHAENLIRIHGGSYEPGLEQLESNLESLEAAVVSAKNILLQREEDVKSVKVSIEAYKKRIADAKPKSAQQPQSHQNQQGQRR
jgi:hypothetical protein